MANELFLAVPSIQPQNKVNSDTSLLDFNPESQQINGNSMAELIRAVHGLDYGMEEDELSFESLQAIGEAVSALLAVIADVQGMVDNTTVTQLQSQNATSTQTTGNGRKKEAETLKIHARQLILLCLNLNCKQK